MSTDPSPAHDDLAPAPATGTPLSPNARKVLGVVAALGVASLAAGLLFSPARAWTALLTSGYYYLVLALGGAAFVALMSAAKAGWYVGLKRVPEALAGCLPLGAAAMIATLPGVTSLYPWTHGGGYPIQRPFLNVPFFIVRMVVFLGLWLLFSQLLRKQSRAQDADRRLAHTGKSVAISAAFIVLLGVTFCAASIDWLMSLSPKWSSTIFGFYNIAGLLEGGMAVIALTVLLLRRRGMLPWVNENHLHDLGKLMFAMAVFWAYLWFSQYLLIWYANLPNEIPYYLVRTRGGWAPLFYGNLVANWLIPFLVLLPRPNKRNERILLVMAVFMLLARWLDVYLMATPAGFPHAPAPTFMDIGAFLGLGALFVLFAERNLRGAPLLPQADPYLVESLQHQQ